MDNTVTSVGWLNSGAVVGAILYDLIPLLDPERYIGWEPARRWYHDKLDSLRRCDLLLCISDSAAREATDALGIAEERVVAISTAADEKFVDAVVTTAEIEACRRRFGIQRRYLMHSGNVEARKNFDGLIRAYAALPLALRRKFQLVLVGKVSGEGQQHLEAEAVSAGLASGELVLTGHVTDEDLLALYAGCHLFVFPSLHEGFGLPALEAMHQGVPTIGSNTSSVPEVIGRADACFDPTSKAAMTALLHRCLTDDSFYAELKSHSRVQASRFNWDSIARHTWQTYEDALLTRPVSPGRPTAARDNWSVLMASQLVAPPQAPPPDDAEMAELAQCMAFNELEVTRSKAQASPGQGLLWRIEGPFDSSYSLALVNREAARALVSLGHSVVLHSTEGPGDFPANPAFLEANADLKTMYLREAVEPAVNVDIQARNLYPPRVYDMVGRLSMLHQYAWEESGFPLEWVKSFNEHLSGITCTSVHVQKVLQDNGVTVPTAVVGNGVDHWDRVIATRGMRFPGKGLRLLHVSSCFPRKGADVMLAAYGDAFTQGDDVSLVIKTFANPHNDIAQQIEVLRKSNPRYPDVHLIEDDLSDSDLKALVEHCHVLVAPSRAEGFGLPLAEALLSGLPVITTRWSAQLDFCTDLNSWLVDFNFLPAQSHFKLYGSVWAEPDRTSLTNAMRAAYASSHDERRTMAANGRELLLRHFKWQDVAARAVAAVRDWSTRPKAPPPRIGWVTTWNTRCGIASYSRHLIEAAAQHVTVLAPRQSGLLQADEGFVLRSWLSGKERNAFGELSLTITDQALDVLVIQFNYGFYQLHDFSKFLHGQIDAGRTVIVTMHATSDPPTLAVWDENWRLATVREALARCHRLLVHTLSDMNKLKEAGLVGNVTMFPHPLWQMPQFPAASQSDQALPLIATFGYCLPHKGLPETLYAVNELRRRGQPVRLLMLNSEYPDATSRALVQQLRQQIEDLDLSTLVEFRSDYLSDIDAAESLSRADLLLFAYQNTQESASGAVRHGMASLRPVIVTPISIFDDLGEAVFRTPGIDAQRIADGLSQTLAACAERSPQALASERAAAAWRTAHDVGALAHRLINLCHALAPMKNGIHCDFDGSSRTIRSEVGEIEYRSLKTTGRPGHLLFGPYLALAPGRYMVELIWSYEIPESANCILRIVLSGGRIVICEQKVVPGVQLEPVALTLRFDLEESCGDLEIQAIVDGQVRASIRHVIFKSCDGAVLAPSASLDIESKASQESPSTV